MKPIFLIVGRTASGKDTLVNELCNKLRMKQLISWTTRPPRSAAENTHKFGTLEDFKEFSAHNMVVAHTVINGNLYWATTTDLLESDFYIIDPDGLHQLKSNFPDMPFVTIYIHAPRSQRRKRFLLRQPGCDELFEQRDASENMQFQLFENNSQFDYVIENDKFEDAIWQLSLIVENEINILRKKENAF